MHNNIFRQYLLLSKACYMFWRSQRAFVRHRLKNIGEYKPIMYKSLLLKKGTEISLSQTFRILFYTLAETEIEVKIFN